MLYEEKEKVRLNKITKIILGIVIIVAIVILVCWNILDNSEKVTDINKYEKYFGAEGKYKEH